MKCVNKVEFIFENCENFELDSKDIIDFYIKDVKEEILRIASNSICKIKTANEVVISISNKAKNISHMPFGIEKNKTNPIDRLVNFKDITSLILHYNDGTEETYCVNWCGEKECENRYQKHYVSLCGDLYIVVSENTNVFDYFNKKLIDDEGEMNFRRKMIC